MIIVFVFTVPIATNHYSSNCDYCDLLGGGGGGRMPCRQLVPSSMETLYHGALVW